MKFDTIIIGGGLTGLTCGIKLAENNQKCAIISTGQSAINFFSGSLDLLNRQNNKDVTNPLEAIKNLPLTHPYHRVGLENIKQLADDAPELLSRAGLTFSGVSTQNHFVLTPMGTMKPTWLTLDDFTTFDQPDSFPYKKAVIVNFKGFLDFHSLFIKDGLSKFNAEIELKEVAMKQFEAIRKNPSEMRSSNIAKVFDQGSAIDEFAIEINKICADAEVVILPAVFGIFNSSVAANLKQKIDKPVLLIPVVPPSTPGIRSQIMLRKRFQQLGGTYFLGDMVESGTFNDNRLTSVTTKNHGNIALEADNYVLASGSFYSKGIMATPKGIFEPTFGLDVESNTDRGKWFDEQVFNDQAFMYYGVKTDNKFHALLNSKPIENMYVAGSVLSGANPIKEGSGAGICLITAIHTAEQLLR